MNIRPNIFVLPVINDANANSIKNLLHDAHLVCGNARYNGGLAVTVQFYGAGQRETILSVAKTFAKLQVVEIDTARLAHKVNLLSGATEVLGNLITLPDDAPLQDHLVIGNKTYGFRRVFRKAAA